MDGFEELAEVAFDDAVEGVEGEVEAVVGKAVLGKIIGTDALGTVAGTAQGKAGGADFGFFFLAAGV